MDALVDAFAARQPAGLEEAYALWSRDFYALARHTVSDPALAEDCVHDALIRVWRSPNRFAGDRAMLKAYLLACVRNESMTALRAKRRREARELRATRLAEPLAEDVAPLDPVEAARLRSAIERLPSEQRIALERAYYGNRTYAEVARELDAPLGTIKSRIALAIRKLHRELFPSEASA